MVGVLQLVLKPNGLARKTLQWARRDEEVMHRCARLAPAAAPSDTQASVRCVVDTCMNSVGGPWWRWGLWYGQGVGLSKE